MNFAFRTTNTVSVVSLKPLENCTEIDLNAGRLNILLLQGPSGPFFRVLEDELTQTGSRVKRIVFNNADRFFSHRSTAETFSGSLKLWENWLHNYFNANRPDIVILFGSSRPAHLKARKLARQYGVLVIALEEGYLRSGYISCEISGNNQYSPLAFWQPEQNDHIPQTPLTVHSSHWYKSLWVVAYYCIRELTSMRSKDILSHRRLRRLDNEVFSWLRHIGFSSISKLSNHSTKSEMLGKQKDKFLLIPLQTPNDSQIRFASKGWNNKKLISSCLRAAKQVAIDELLVFKTHPLDEQSSELKQFIENSARKLGLRGRVRVISSGKLSELVPCSSGMIVINSTAAFSALHNHKPILVMGDAVFRHDQIVTMGETPADIAAFIKDRNSKCPEKIKMFINDVKVNALVPGDFYLSDALQLTAKNVVKKVEAIVSSSGLELTQ